MMIDFDKLLEPYSMHPGGIPHTKEAIVKWLTDKGIPLSHVHQAMLIVFDEIQRGRIFLDELNEDGSVRKPATFELDHEIQRKAVELHRAEVTDNLNKLQEAFNAVVSSHTEQSISEAINKMRKPINWLQRFGKWLFRL
jgi:hypothetical protein